MIDKKSLETKIKKFSTFGGLKEGGITRYCFGVADIGARDYFIERMSNIGCEVYFDDMLNVYAKKVGSDPHAKNVVIASHSDSVYHGGNYDGILGVISAMEVLETVHKHDLKHKDNLIAMIWTNEEGSLFPPALMSSGVICNNYLPEEIKKHYLKENMLNSRSLIDKHVKFKDALETMPYKGNEKNRFNHKDYKAMFELHIEQGPILIDKGFDVGVVDCVLGMNNYTITCIGESNHAGTTPMNNRKDALFAMSKVINFLHDNLSKIDNDLVFTTGEIFCSPNIHTIIPSKVSISLDIRHESKEVLTKCKNIVSDIPKLIEKCEVKVEESWSRDTVYFDKELISCVKNYADELNYKNDFIHSGAGHDAQFASYVCPTTMIFVPSVNGRSHCVEEYSNIDSIVKCVEVLLKSVLKIANK